jgi:hypothetical protein
MQLLSLSRFTVSHRAEKGKRERRRIYKARTEKTLVILSIPLLHE